jgi:hypothetical protein
LTGNRQQRQLFIPPNIGAHCNRNTNGLHGINIVFLRKKYEPMTKSNKKINVQDKITSIVSQNDQDYISLTDMVKTEEGEDHIRNWMRNRNTVEFIGLWETLHNPDFKPVEFDTFRKQAGLNSFNLTPRKWIEATNAVGIFSKSGRYGGTYAH